MPKDYLPVIAGGVLVGNKTYNTRKIGRKQDVFVLREYREAGQHTLTYGQSGTGKSLLTQAAYEGQMVTLLGSEDTTAADFIGDYIPLPGGKWKWVDGPLLTAMENGWVLYIDEINRIRTKQLSVVFSAMDYRREVNITAGGRGLVKAKPGFAVAASANLTTGGALMDDALLSRFKLKLEISTDYTMLREKMSVDSALVTAAENMDVRRRSGEMSWAPQMREILDTVDNIALIGEPAALGSLINCSPLKDRDVVARVLSQALGRKVSPLVL